MSNAVTANAVARRRSYLGIGSCCLFVIAAVCVATMIDWVGNAQMKMSLDGIVVVPFAVLLNFAGLVMACFGVRRPAENPLSRTGLVLNLLPIGCLAIAIVFGVLITIGRGS
jgi:hypothetical protein